MMLMISIALATILNSEITAQNRRTYVFDSGILTPGPNQTLRWVPIAGDWDGDGVDLLVMNYSQENCNFGICTLNFIEMQSIHITDLASNQGAKIDIPHNSDAVRVRMLSRNGNIQVNLAIIDNTTGKVVVQHKLRSDIFILTL